MERLYNCVIIFSSITAFSTWIFCKIKDKNFIHIYYTPHYLLWMFVTYSIFAYKTVKRISF
jgi:hypothetical protein